MYAKDVSTAERARRGTSAHTLQESGPAEISAPALPVCETKRFSGCGTRSQHAGRPPSQFPELELEEKRATHSGPLHELGQRLLDLVTRSPCHDDQ